MGRAQRFPTSVSHFNVPRHARFAAVPIRSAKLVLTLIIVVNTLINQVNMANRNSALYLE